MTAEQTKARREMQIFLEFLEKSGLPVDRDSIENRKPPEPDILCRHKEQEFIAFELAELCEEELAEKIGKSIKAGGVIAEFMWNADPTKRIICEKLEKKYTTAHPIELLCYTVGRIITTDDAIIPTIQVVINSRGPGSFRRVWLLDLDKEVCQIIFEL